MTHDCLRHTPGPTCYQKCKCRCGDCRQGQARYAKRWRVRTAQGINDLVDAAPAREHVERLMRLGMSHGTIAVAAGMPNSGLQALLGLKSNAKPLQRMHRRSVHRILAVTYTPTVGRSFVPAAGTMRRLQDLALRGFGAAEVTTLSGIQKHTITEVRSGSRSFVRTTTAETIEALHRRLEGQSPTLTSPRGRAGIMTVARRNGYAPLAAFDDVDNEKERPKGVVA